MSKRTGKKVTKLPVKKSTKKADKKKKPMNPATRRKELEGEMQKAGGLINGLTQRLKEAEATVLRIQGALEILKELE